ncbi:type I-E CRISPR-associated protein Cas7/Cse4/CasC [Anaeromyxobacter oryzisoli]|uniref:type I-E CRISPR-associated protein Cas7/Cse4/CasC n=1 Tax=Anaeromyxobacter oryzisoli TaxID=2925408 RepID=UPI001F5682E4|nr:type I-E CRISPR-associated protein Cas7/Cse4/CasC [Anaeromyxobacter sp. SG63]
MSNTFLQLHFLTPYAPSNLNRDDLGRPKTALFGGSQRLRVSSQSLKRAWRTSTVFETELAEHLGTRTKRFGDLVLPILQKSLDEKKAKKLASRLAGHFGAVKEEGLRTEQLAHITPEEQRHLEKLAAKLAREDGREPTDEELAGLLGRARGAADVALFGRMLAAKTEFNVEAACQVAHAISIHKVAIEDDYFTAVDDLKPAKEDAGAAHVGTQEFASAVLYHYVCVDRGLLAENLGGDEDLLHKTLRALGEACLTVAPNGKQNSFASRSRAHFALVEKGSSQPRSLASAFLRPVTGDDLLADGVKALQTTRQALDAIYEDVVPSAYFDASTGSGTKEAVLDFFAEA